MKTYLLFGTVMLAALVTTQPMSADTPQTVAANEPAPVDTSKATKGGEPAQTDQEVPPAPWKMGWTGAVSEEEFKALHRIDKKDAPPPGGVWVEVAGERAYLSVPPKATPPMPGIVVIQEWWGLNDNIVHWSDRLAADGYAALAVDLYDGKVADSPDSAMAYMQSVNEARSLEILLAAQDFLAKDKRVQASRRGVIGWCFGGGWSLQTALNVEDLDAAVIYYGRLVTDPERLRAIEAPLLGIFAKQDKTIPPSVVQEFDQALTKADVEHTILEYDAAHAFANPSSPPYNEEAAAAAWKETRAFLAKHLKPEKGTGQ